MRIRLISHPPLAQLKVWFATNGESGSILDLKRKLIREIDSLHGVFVGQLLLELDGFELLDSTACVHVLKDNDLVE